MAIKGFSEATSPPAIAPTSSLSRQDYIGGVIVFCATVTTLLWSTVFQDLSPAKVGLAINYTLLVPVYLNWVVRFLADTEMCLNAVERVQQYATLPAEDARRATPARGESGAEGSERGPPLRLPVSIWVYAHASDREREKVRKKRQIDTLFECLFVFYSSQTRRRLATAGPPAALRIGRGRPRDQAQRRGHQAFLPVGRWKAVSSSSPSP